VFAPRKLSNSERLYWTTPAATFLIPANMSALEFRLRSGGQETQRVTVRIAGEVADELTVWGGDWQRARYVMRPSDETAIALELTTTPEWTPAFDFRTIGVGIDRVWGLETEA
jgi:hypothetical protein